MKKSNQAILLLAIFFLSGVLITDHLLSINYSTLDLKDPYRNFMDIAVKPFKALRIAGGNHYSIRIKRGEAINLKLLRSRKDFFKILSDGDTLSLRFNVAGGSSGQPYDAVNGLIITMPSLAYIHLTGTLVSISDFRQDSLTIEQETNTRTILNDLSLHHLSVTGKGAGLIDGRNGNTADHITVNLSNTSAMLMSEFHFHQFSPHLEDSSTLILNKTGLKMFEESYKNQ